jgi:hypothetical protein
VHVIELLKEFFLLLNKNMVSKETRKRWDNRIKYCRNHLHLLNDWEIDFILDLEERRYYEKDITMNQSIKLNEIYYKIYN